MKKFLSVIMAIVSIFSFSQTKVFAQDVLESEINEIDTLSIDSPNVQVSDAMTFSEMVSYYASSKNISYEEALTFFPNHTLQTYASVYAPIKYRVLTVNLNVTSTYRPYLEFYCQTSENGNYWGILNVYSCQLVRAYKGISKQFEGNVNFWLRSAYQIEYAVNGDFFENGSTTHTAETGLNVGVGASASVSYSVSYASDHYKYCYVHNMVDFQK